MMSAGLWDSGFVWWEKERATRPAPRTRPPTAAERCAGWGRGGEAGHADQADEQQADRGQRQDGGGGGVAGPIGGLDAERPAAGEVERPEVGPPPGRPDRDPGRRLDLAGGQEAELVGQPRG